MDLSDGDILGNAEFECADENCNNPAGSLGAKIKFNKKYGDLNIRALYQPESKERENELRIWLGWSKRF